METLEILHRKLEGADDLKSVVRTMKALAASNIGQYEKAVDSLDDYLNTIALGLFACFLDKKTGDGSEIRLLHSNKEGKICAIVFGSDQGLVGQFNDSLSSFVSQSLQTMIGKKEIWAVGERIQLQLADAGFHSTNLFSLPNSVNAIAPLVHQILIKSEQNHQKGDTSEVYIFHNRPKQGSGYEAIGQRLFPLDKKWRQSFSDVNWPTKKIPQVIGGAQKTILALIHEFFFTSLFKACAESLSSENTSRLAAMQRAEKNIDELLDELSHKFHSLRQSSIDEELFDVVSGFEAFSQP